jgi:hypothetical protein
MLKIGNTAQKLKMIQKLGHQIGAGSGLVAKSSFNIFTYTNLPKGERPAINISRVFYCSVIEFTNSE